MEKLDHKYAEDIKICCIYVDVNDNAPEDELDTLTPRENCSRCRPLGREGTGGYGLH